MRFLILLLLLTASVYGQNYELYTGSVIHEDKDNKPGYLIGLNFTVKLNQDRKYLNTLLFGVEHSAFMSGNIKLSTGSSSSDIQECNCDIDNIDFKGNNYILKKETRAVSLNFGVEITKKWYLLSGVTNYQHINKVNNEKINEYRETYIDAGVKYFIKSKDWYFAPFF